ncbi:hypothetical protein [Nocardia sp. NPDC051832]|uniref:hypothetical protein n=1 Tax=Nocardia sp. NPDC051832 TaxID=3155673 RepID=UPI00343AC731
MGLIGIKPVSDNRGAFNWLVLMTTDSAWKLAKQLLDRSQVATDIAAAIRARPDPAGDGVALCGGCTHCGEPLNILRNPAMREDMAQRRFTTLTSVGLAECSVVKWHRALYDPARQLTRL